MTRMNWSKASSPRRGGVARNDYSAHNSLSRRARAAEHRWAGDYFSEYKSKKIFKRTGSHEKRGERYSSTVTRVATRDLDEATRHLAGATSAVVHCDGGCSPNPGVGGFAAIVQTDLVRIDLFGGDRQTTNNRMELRGAISALKVLPAACPVILISDSRYVIDGASHWMSGWARKGWRRNGEPIPNADHWRELHELVAGRSVSWRWVRGHAGDALNEQADALAARGRREAAR